MKVLTDSCLYLEDFNPGDRFEMGSYYLSAKEVIAFGRQYDPLPMHLGEEEARQTPLGRLCASGLQTLAVAQRLLVEGLFGRTALIAGVGVDNLRLSKPVYAEQLISTVVEIAGTRLTSGKKGRGILSYIMRVFDQENDEVARCEANLLVSCRQGPGDVLGQDTFTRAVIPGGE